MLQFIDSVNCLGGTTQLPRTSPPKRPQPPKAGLSCDPYGFLHLPDEHLFSQRNTNSRDYHTPLILNGLRWRSRQLSDPRGRLNCRRDAVALEERSPRCGCGRAIQGSTEPGSPARRRGHSDVRSSLPTSDPPRPGDMRRRRSAARYLRAEKRGCRWRTSREPTA